MRTQQLKLLKAGRHAPFRRCGAPAGMWVAGRLTRMGAECTRPLHNWLLTGMDKLALVAELKHVMAAGKGLHRGAHRLTQL